MVMHPMSVNAPARTRRDGEMTRLWPNVLRWTLPGGSSLAGWALRHPGERQSVGPDLGQGPCGPKAFSPTQADRFQRPCHRERFKRFDLQPCPMRQVLGRGEGAADLAGSLNPRGFYLLPGCGRSAVPCAWPRRRVGHRRERLSPVATIAQGRSPHHRGQRHTARWCSHAMRG